MSRVTGGALLASGVATTQPASAAEVDALYRDMVEDLTEAVDLSAFVRRHGLEPYDYQLDVLRSNARQIVLNWCRQAGKSTITSYLPAHQAIYYPGSLTILVGPGERQAKILLDKVGEVFEARARNAALLEVDNVLYLRLDNGSEIYALPGKGDTIRGFSDVDLLVADEASRIPESLFHAVRPMRAKGNARKPAGRIVLLSTPAGKRGSFYNACVSTTGRWYYSEVPWQRVPHITPEFIVDEREALPSQIFEQEYECAFLDAIGAVFTLEQIERAMSDDTVTPAGLFSIPAASGPLSDPSVQPRAVF